MTTKTEFHSYITQAIEFFAEGDFYRHNLDGQNVTEEADCKVINTRRIPLPSLTMR